MTTPTPLDQYDIDDRLKFNIGINLPSSLQHNVALNGDQPITMLEATASKNVNTVEQAVATHVPNVEVTTQQVSLNRTHFRIGTEDPTDPDGLGFGGTQIRNALTLVKNLTDVNDVPIERIAFVEDVPDYLQRRDALDGAEKYVHMMKNRAHMSNKANEEHNMQKRDLYQLTKGLFIDHDYLDPDRDNMQAFSNKQRSHQVTDWVLTDNGLDHADICDIGRPSDLEALLRSSHERKWWRDTAAPRNASPNDPNQDIIMFGLDEYDGDTSG